MQYAQQMTGIGTATRKTQIAEFGVSGRQHAGNERLPGLREFEERSNHPKHPFDPHRSDLPFDKPAKSDA